MMGKDLVKEAHSSGTVKVLVKMHSGGAKQVFNQFPAALTKYCAELSILLQNVCRRVEDRTRVRSEKCGLLLARAG